MDIKKSRAELRPARVIHRAAEIADQMEKQRVGPRDPEQNIGSKHIDVGGMRAFFTLKGELKATAWTTARYGEEQLAAIKEYAEAD